MNRFINFVKTTAIGGLLVIVPIAIVLSVLAQIFYSLFALAQKLVADIGLAVNDAILIVAIALVSLVALCFFTGLFVRTRFGESSRNWLKLNVARRIPMYNAIASLTNRFAGLDGDKFSPVEVDLFNSDARAIGFLIEELPDNRCAVFIPSAPVATVGKIYVVHSSKLLQLNASVADTITAVSQWGVDTNALYTKVSDDSTD